MIDARSYEEGFRDGVEATLDQLENCSPLNPEGGYTGRRPRALRRWVSQVRRRLASDQPAHMRPTGPERL